MTKKLLMVVGIFVVLASAFFFSVYYFLKIKPSTINYLLSTIHVPEPNETPAEKGIAIPQTSTQLINTATGKTRTYALEANKNTFSIKKIIANQGDILRINLTATDRVYDLTLPAFGLTQRANKGETKLMEFQAVSSGEFQFLCESCKNESTKGILQVLPIQDQK
jgi:heme/copper-type cytochrome/quinol oxidase subunit 2